MEHAAARRGLVEGLLRHVEASQHPSPQLLERVERSIDSVDAAGRYTDVLLAKCEVAHPSLAMLDRADRMVRRLERAAPLDDHPETSGEAAADGHDDEPQEDAG